MRWKWSTALAAFAGLALWIAPAEASAAVHQPRHLTAHNLAAPNLGPNVIVFTPSEPQASIQAELDTISTQQVPNQFGTQRYSIFFEPGTYGSAADPLDFQVGYYTQVAGLGAMPSDVVINGAINVYSQCSNGTCVGSNNFWRSLSNLTLNVNLPSSPPPYAPDPNDPYGDGCVNSTDMWAVSQAAPMRRVIVNGTLTLQDYCSPQGYVSGGFMADDEFNGGTVANDGQQQWFVRNSNLDGWSNAVWNQVFMGDNGAPATNFNVNGGQYTTLPTSGVSEEEPFLYTNSQGELQVFVPALRHDSVGPSYASGTEAGHSIPISKFFIANPGTPTSAINAALAAGSNLLLTPGVYHLSQTIDVTNPNTIVMGLGFATLVPEHGDITMATASVPGIKLSGLIFDAGDMNSPVLLRLGDHDQMGPGSASPSDPTLVQDVFFRIGGATPGKATVSMLVNDNYTILDDIWAWRADHGAGAGWTSNTANTGLIVNGNGVFADGLAVEHYQKTEVIWRGQDGQDVFFQNEMPYDPPSQAAWMQNATTLGYPAFQVEGNVTSFHGYGMGSYSFFNQGVPIYATQAFLAPNTPGVQFNDLLTVFLNSNGGEGGINSVIDGVGGSSTIANPDTAVDVTQFP